MKRFADKVVVITGAASGLGLATAERVVTEGARVLLVDRDSDGLAKSAARLDGAKVATYVADVSSREEVRCYVAEALKLFGRIDGFFNNAGVVGPLEITEDFDPDEFRRVVEINLNGVFFGLAEVLKVMREQGSGSVVNTASTEGIRGQGNHSAYTASKHGVVGLTRNCAIEYGSYGIQVNAIAPGAIVTAMLETGLRSMVGDDWENALNKFVEVNPMKRAGRTEEVAALVAFLLSGEALYVNGTVIPIDGGQSCKF